MQYRQQCSEDNYRKRIVVCTEHRLILIQYFITIEPAVEGTIEGTIEGARPTTKRKLAVLLQAILYNEKKRVPDYSKITGMSRKTVERYIKILREHELIDFTDGANQVGGYIVNSELKEIIK
ncbi:hypothetical protein C4F40_03410 [Sphingobacterium sp. Ka21]|uniref:Helix-turn-helix type 11 domain-containing protein n=1 Tax=Sphingobacterium pedocola TaxID=2082722 RepID=A0ABR9T345_9SPHI|nr:hypothetical protein [Sphingobacterium pedocola]